MKFVVITGASDGIGRELAIQFARLGHSVGLLARRQDMLQETAIACKAAAPSATQKIVWAVLDVKDLDGQRKILGDWWTEQGGIDLFVANAGLGLNNSDTEDCFKDIHSMVQVNIIGAINGLEYLKPKMVERKQGTLAGITSIAAARGMPKTGGYCLTKAALHSYLEALRMDMRPYGVTVCEAAPGYIDTAMTKVNKFHMPFLMKPDSAAAIIAKNFLRNKKFTVVPWQFRAVYPLLKNIPERLVDFFTRDGI
jgi:short-subunit dehydrogenase